jgi:uncharacterized protein YndB with AHSA1/START domain
MAMAMTAHQIRVNATPGQVFDALSTIDGLTAWYTPQIEGTVGKNQEAVFRFQGREPFRWRFTELTPGSLARWQCIEGPGSSPGTLVTFRLTGKDDGSTVVECDHDGWSESDPAYKTCNTLWGILIGHLKDYAESGTPAPAFP